MISIQIKKSLAVLSCASVLLAQTFAFGAMASDSDVQILEINKRGDIELSCNSLSQEAVLMRDIIATTQDIKNGAKMNGRGIGVIGAIGGLVIGTATGGVGLAAAGLLANHLNDEKNDKADNIQDIAAQRRTFMVGIYNAKGCYGPIEHAMNIQEPVAIDDASEEVSAHLASIMPASGPQYYAERRGRYNE